MRRICDYQQLDASLLSRVEALAKDPARLSDAPPSIATYGARVMQDVMPAIAAEPMTTVAPEYPGALGTALCEDFAEAIGNPYGRMRRRLLQYRRVSSSAAYVQVQKFDTTLYHLAHADPLRGYEEIQAGSKAIVIAFMGSGSARGSGAGFMRNAASLWSYGVSMLSFDYPYHGLGPRDAKYDDSAVFLRQVTDIVNHYASTGLPIYLFGHSFGCILEQEILRRWPDLVRGVLMVSPGGNQTPRLLAHYLRFRFSPRWNAFLAAENFSMDRRAEIWSEGEDGAGGVGGQFGTTHDVSPIATDVPVVIIAGEHDPWSSPDMLQEIANRFPRGTLRIISGTGHGGVFAKKRGKENLLAAEMLDVVRATVPGVDFRKEKRRDPRSMLLSNLQRALLFREWFESHGWHADEVVDDAQAQSIMERWDGYINLYILSTALKKIGILERVSGCTFSQLLDRLEGAADMGTFAGGDGAVTIAVGDRPLEEISHEVRQTLTAQYRHIIAIMAKGADERSARDYDHVMNFINNGVDIFFHVLEGQQMAVTLRFPAVRS